jgi:Tol biopolymer transport system component
MLRPLLLAALALAASCRDDPLPAEREDGAVRLTPNRGSEQNPCVLDDGERILFTRFSSSYNDGPSDLVILELATGRETRLLGDDDHDHVDLPGHCITASGDRLVLASDREERDEIWLLDLETDALTRLTDSAAPGALEPSFVGPAEELVVFQHGGDGSGQLWTVPVTGGPPTLLSDGTADDRQPGGGFLDDRIVFQSDRSGTWGLFTIPASGGAPGLLWDTEAEETDPSFAPGSDAVVFATDDCAALSCPAVWRDGMVSIHPTPPGWYDGAPTLLPDGRLVFEATRGDPDDDHVTALYVVPEP